MRKYIGEYTITQIGEIDQRPYFDIEFQGELINVRMLKKGRFIQDSVHDETSEFLQFPVLPLRSSRIGRICIYHLGGDLHIHWELACGRLVEEVVVTPGDFQ
jgi:hypothetical protein